MVSIHRFGTKSLNYLMVTLMIFFVSLSHADHKANTSMEIVKIHPSSKSCKADKILQTIEETILNIEFEVK